MVDLESGVAKTVIEMERGMTESTKRPVLRAIKAALIYATIFYH
jgi:hypothetical protein